MSSFNVSPDTRDRGRSTLVGARLAGGGAAAALLFCVASLVAAITRSGAPWLGLVAAVIAAVGVVWLPPRLLAVTRHGAVARAAVDGARTAGRALSLGFSAAIAALATASLVTSVGSDLSPASTSATYLWAAVAALIAGVGLVVVFPGAWLLPGRPLSGRVAGARRLWPMLMLAGLALVYPGAWEVFVGVSGRLPSSPGLVWDALAIGGLGAVSTAGWAAAGLLLTRPAAAIAMDPRGQRAVVARRGGARLVDVSSGAVLARFVEGERVVAVAPDGGLLALAGQADEIVVRRLSDGALVRRLSGAPRGLAALAFDWASGRLAAVGDAAAVAIWDLGAPKPTPERHPTLVSYGRSLAFDRRGETLRVASAAGVVSELSLADAAPLRAARRPPMEVSRAVLSPDGRVVVCATGADPVRDRVTSLRVQGGHLVEGWTRPVGETVRAIAVGADGAVAVACLDRGVRVVDANGSSVGTLSAHVDGVGAIAIDAAGTCVVVSGPWTVTRWDVATGERVRLEVADDRLTELGARPPARSER